MIRFDVITLFPELFSTFMTCGVTGRAFSSGAATLVCHQLRDFATDQYRSVDDRSYGGGPGMVLLPAPLHAAINHARSCNPDAEVWYLSAQGKPFVQQDADALAQSTGVILLCGRYEGIDERILALDVDKEVCVGDFVLSGGELPAQMVIDATCRLLPGVLGNNESADNESFRGRTLDHAHYTRPAIFAGMTVPAVLRSGDHAAIAAWRKANAQHNTTHKRPDLADR